MVLLLYWRFRVSVVVDGWVRAGTVGRGLSHGGIEKYAVRDVLSECSV